MVDFYQNVRYHKLTIINLCIVDIDKDISTNTNSKYQLGQKTNQCQLSIQINKSYNCIFGDI